MHSLRKYQGFIIYQTWADIESFGTDKSVPYEALINKITISLIKERTFRKVGLPIRQGFAG